MIIHQIFGLLGDTILPPLFVEQQAKVKEWCKINQYEYKLWGVDYCNELIEKYPIYKDFYNTVKYTIMKVDIIRWLILYDNGGCYLDMDIAPVIKSVDINDRLVIGYKSGKRKFYDMEFIQLSKGHHIAIDFINYMREQIVLKEKIAVYKEWKMRFVFQTTGPDSLTRYLKINNIKPKKYILNHSCRYNNKWSLNINGNEDFISLPSVSYENKMN